MVSQTPSEAPVRDILSELKPQFAALSSDSLTFEQLARLLCDKRLLTGCTNMLQSLGLAQRKDAARIMLSSFMLTRFPDVMSCEDADLLEEAEGLLAELAALFLQEDTSRFEAKYQRFQSLFVAWHAKDRQTLQSNLKAELSAGDALLRSLRQQKDQDPRVLSEWQPHLTALRSQLQTMLSRLESLEPAKQQISNEQIAHDLFLEGPERFNYFRLYMPEHEAVLEANTAELTADPTPARMLEALESIKKTLMGLIPVDGPTRRGLEEALDLEQTKTQIANGAFDPLPYLRFIHSTMTELCAPIRDKQIQELQKILESGDITSSLSSIMRLLSQMSSDSIMFSAAQALPHLPTIVVQYERDAFASRYQHCSGSLRTERLVRQRVYRREGMKEEELAAQLLQICMEGDAGIETLELDMRRIQAWKEEIGQIAEISAKRLTGKATVDPSDPTLQLMFRRIQSSFLDGILSTSNADQTNATLNQEEQTALSALISNARPVFLHHCKVYQPIYHHLLNK